VVALDRKVLTHAVALKFAGVNRYDGNRYLEKIFPFFFELPQPSGAAVHRLVSTILGTNSGPPATAEPGKQTATDLANELDALATALGDPSFANPRLIKRCINRFRLILEFEKETAKDAGPTKLRSASQQTDRLVVLARWIAASERWPSLRRLLASRGDELWSRLGESRNGDDSLDADMRALLEEDGVEAWMRKELLSGKGQRIAEYREADQRLRAWGL